MSHVKIAMMRKVRQSATIICHLYRVKNILNVSITAIISGAISDLLKSIFEYEEATVTSLWFSLSGKMVPFRSFNQSAFSFCAKAKPFITKL